jgi:hypothetical protein
MVLFAYPKNNRRLIKMNNILVGVMVFIFIVVTVFAVRMENGKGQDTENEKDTKVSKK